MKHFILGLVACLCLAAPASASGNAVVLSRSKVVAVSSGVNLVAVPNNTIFLNNVAVVPSVAVVQNVKASGGASASVAGRNGVAAAASGSRRAVVRTGGLRGLIFGNVARSR